MKNRKNRPLGRRDRTKVPEFPVEIVMVVLFIVFILATVLFKKKLHPLLK